MHVVKVFGSLRGVALEGVHEWLSLLGHQSPVCQMAACFRRVPPKVAHAAGGLMLPLPACLPCMSLLRTWLHMPCTCTCML